ncbi:MAG TPA: metalloregulator ArsR/SmtB family transcription factor [Candidatus Limnocylindrales bacterium]|nr:metalloregulator ArsR/SmtB family transcription factor [Candidatus Limnocylindrales bacterium]
MDTYIQSGLAALGDPTRLAIFEMLGEHPQAVKQLAAGLPVSRPAVSQHLRRLKEARLVRDRREGTRRVYELNPDGLALLRDHFAKLWDQALSAFKKFAEEEHQKEKNDGSRTSTIRGGKKNNPRKRPH